MRILLISPVANRSGSVTTLLNYMHYAPKGVHTFGFFSRRPGQLAADGLDFKQYSSQVSDRFNYRIYEAIYHRLFKNTPHVRDLKRVHIDFKPDLWYINTIAMPEYAKLAIELGQPYVLHVHELPQEYDEQGYDSFREMLENARLLLTASQTVVENLTNMGYTNVVLMHGLINVEQIQPKRDRSAIRRELGLADDAFVWLMSGAWSTRKGFDMIPEIVQHLPKSAHFVWMGPARYTGLTYYVQQYIATYNLPVTFLKEQSDDYFDYFNACDGFVLTSREDSYPIVMREAAVLGKPIVGFNSGGIREFVKPGMGEMVESFNPKDLADAMIRVMNGDNPIDVARLQSAITSESQRAEAKRWIDTLNQALLMAPTPVLL